MATLVLSTVGTALAGPIGGLLGSLVGQSIDQQLLGSGARKGPRLGDLSVQTSSYGTQIPRIYGTMRVAGTVVWATDLKEDSELQGDGKSQPETVVYTYSASFAVALSCRRAVRVRRIWADGQLIRGAAGDLKVSAKLRFYGGTESQPVDPLIGSIEGLDQAPAYRGIALAVFEDLQLGSFGNRIPSLTFELVADDAPAIAIGTILTDASGGAIRCTDARTVGGYAAHGEDMASALAPLVEAFAIELNDEAGALRTPSAPVVHEPAPEALGAHFEAAGSAVFAHEQTAATALPTTVTLAYYDPARDFQTGQARSALPGPSRVVRALSLPCVLAAGAAKAAAEDLLTRAWALRERLTVRLPTRFLDVRPGDLVRIPGQAGDWVVETVEIERFVVNLGLRPAWALAGERSGDPGRSNPQPDVIALPTRMALMDLPEPGTTEPTLALAAASPSGGWKPVPIEITTGGGVYASRTALREAVLGESLASLGAGDASLFDQANMIEVQLANADHWLQSRDDEALAMGANLAAIGDELVQFGLAEALTPGRFRLSKLLRGRRGTEWAMGDHQAGEAFVLLDARSISTIVVPAELIGTSVTVTAHGPGDGIDPPSVSRVANGEAMRPLSPAHLRAAIAADGTLGVSWIHRSRLAYPWLDQVEAPSDPAVQGYRLRLASASAAIERDVAEEQASFTSAEVASLGAGPIEIDIRQVGLLALSRPASLIINP